MGEVIQLARFTNEDTLALLRALMVATSNGDIVGVDVRIRFKSGKEKRATTGPFVTSLLSRPDKNGSGHH